MLNLDKYQLDWVCRHLGHSDNVHKTHYRQMSDMIERVHVTKLLLLQDMNLTHKFKGQKLEDIDLSGIKYHLHCFYLIFTLEILVFNISVIPLVYCHLLFSKSEEDLETHLSVCQSVAKPLTFAITFE